MLIITAAEEACVAVGQPIQLSLAAVSSVVLASWFSDHLVLLDCRRRSGTVDLPCLGTDQSVGAGPLLGGRVVVLSCVHYLNERRRGRRVQPA